MGILEVHPPGPGSPNGHLTYSTGHQLLIQLVILSGPLYLLLNRGFLGDVTQICVITVVVHWVCSALHQLSLGDLYLKAWTGDASILLHCMVVMAITVLVTLVRTAVPHICCVIGCGNETENTQVYPFLPAPLQHGGLREFTKTQINGNIINLAWLYDCFFFIQYITEILRVPIKQKLLVETGGKVRVSGGR